MEQSRRGFSGSIGLSLVLSVVAHIVASEAAAGLVGAEGAAPRELAPVELTVVERARAVVTDTPPIAATTTSSPRTSRRAPGVAHESNEVVGREASSASSWDRFHVYSGALDVADDVEGEPSLLPRRLDTETVRSPLLALGEHPPLPEDPAQPRDESTVSDTSPGALDGAALAPLVLAIRSRAGGVGRDLPEAVRDALMLDERLAELAAKLASIERLVLVEWAGDGTRTLVYAESRAGNEALDPEATASVVDLDGERVRARIDTRGGVVVCALADLAWVEAALRSEDDAEVAIARALVRDLGSERPVSPLVVSIACSDALPCVLEAYELEGEALASRRSVALDSAAARSPSIAALASVSTR